MTKRQRQNFDKRLGRAIRVRRTAEGLSQVALAKRIGLSRPSVINIEQGGQGIRVSQLYDVADALGCSVNSLLP